MRKTLIIMILFVLVGVILFNRQNSQIQSPVSQRPTPTPPQQSMLIQLGEDKYAYRIFTLDNPGRLILIPNFAESASASALVEANRCRLAVNGGFYGHNNLPVGLFIVDGKRYSRQSASTLVNGFFSIDDGQSSISAEPSFSGRIIIQSGPLLMKNGQVLDLQLVDDKISRRTWVGKTSDGRLVFSSVYIPQVQVLGPRLDDLPKIVELISRQEGLDVVSALNLDGGKASFFRDSDLTINEVTPIGSLFCVQ